MALPKIEYPIFTDTLPSTGQQVRFRPFLVKEEKILLIAAETKSEESILTAVQQVVNNCLLDDIDVEQLPYFDLDYLFIKMRAVSVGNTVTLAYRDIEDEKIREFVVDLNKLQIDLPDDSIMKVKISDSVGVKMRYPTYQTLKDMAALEYETEKAELLLVNCIDAIYDGDDVTTGATLREDETAREALVEWVESLMLSGRDDMEKFFVNLPGMHHEVKYTNDMGNEQTITMRKLTDFFTW